MPRALAPIGRIHTATPDFSWCWSGLPTQFDLVILDEQLDEVHRVRGLTSCGIQAVDAIATRLEGGEQLHWFVEAAVADGLVRSAPTAFGFSRE